MPAGSAKTKSAEGGGTDTKGKNHGVKRVLPKLTKENAVIPDDKLYKYALNKNHPVGGPKAVNFEKILGYNIQNAEEFRAALLNGLDSATKKYKGMNAQKEDIIEAIMPIEGPTGNTARVVSSWKSTPNQEKPFSLITAYIKNRRKGNGESHS
jgi:hypothetical protein